MAREPRGAFLTTMAVLFALLTVSNLTKALQYANNPAVGGVVIFGVRAESIAGNLVLGPLLAIVTGAYAVGLWRQRPWIAPLSCFYAFFVPLNLVLFWYRHLGPEIPPLVFILGYLFLALGGSIGTALYVAYHPGRIGRA